MMTLDGGTDFSLAHGEAATDERVRDEHPSVVLRDLATRRRPQGHVITFANEKGGVGKSTLAFHCAVALAHRGMRVLAVDTATGGSKACIAFSRPATARRERLGRRCRVPPT
jgi:Mrp family chromosome partitioning ATPase